MNRSKPEEQAWEADTITGVLIFKSAGEVFKAINKGGDQVAYGYYIVKYFITVPESHIGNVEETAHIKGDDEGFIRSHICCSPEVLARISVESDVSSPLVLVPVVIQSGIWARADESAHKG